MSIVNEFLSISWFSLLVTPPFLFSLINPFFFLLCFTGGCNSESHSYHPSQDQCWALKFFCASPTPCERGQKSLPAACSSLSMPASVAAHTASCYWRCLRTAHWEELHQAVVPSSFLPRTCAASTWFRHAWKCLFQSCTSLPGACLGRKG